MFRFLYMRRETQTIVIINMKVHIFDQMDKGKCIEDIKSANH